METIRPGQAGVAGLPLALGFTAVRIPLAHSACFVISPGYPLSQRFLQPGHDPGMVKRMAFDPTNMSKWYGEAGLAWRAQVRRRNQAVARPSIGTPGGALPGVNQRFPVTGKRLNLFNATWPGFQG